MGPLRNSTNQVDSFQSKVQIKKAKNINFIFISASDTYKLQFTYSYSQTFTDVLRLIESVISIKCQIYYTVCWQNKKYFFDWRIQVVYSRIVFSSEWDSVANHRWWSWDVVSQQWLPPCVTDHCKYTWQFHSQGSVRKRTTNKWYNTNKCFPLSSMKEMSITCAPASSRNVYLKKKKICFLKFKIIIKMPSVLYHKQ